MKRVFIYYSLTGNGDLLADHLKKEGISIRKVLSKDKMPKNKLLMILIGGFLASINHRSDLIDFNVDLDKYDEVIIGSPIWNGRLSCPINTVLDKLMLDDKKITFIFYSGSGKSPKASKKVRSMYSDIKIINIKTPDDNIDKLKKLLKN